MAHEIYTTPESFANALLYTARKAAERGDVGTLERLAPQVRQAKMGLECSLTPAQMQAREERAKDWARRINEVMDVSGCSVDWAMKAVEYTDTVCGTCNGMGRIDDYVCWTCAGTGKHDARN